MNNVVKLIAVSIFTLSVSACGNAGAGSGAADEAEVTERGVPVEAVTIETGTVRASFQASAVLEAEDETDVIARVNGVVEEILVEEGDFVEQGQPLARLESARYQFARDQIAAELRGVKQELDRMRNLAQQSMVSADQLERTESRYQALKAQLDLAELDLQEAVIRAPISGHVSRRYVKTGNLIQAHQPKTLFHIVNATTLRATLNLPEQAMRSVKAGQRAEIELHAFGAQEKISAEVARVSPVIDSGSGTFRVVLSIPNADHKLRAGMFSRVNLHYAEKESVVRIPHRSILQVDQANYVYIVDDNKARRVAIELGLRENGWIEVTNGLDAGQTLVVTGQNALREDALVEVVSL